MLARARRAVQQAQLIDIIYGRPMGQGLPLHFVAVVSFFLYRMQRRFFFDAVRDFFVYV